MDLHIVVHHFSRFQALKFIFLFIQVRFWLLELSKEVAERLIKDRETVSPMIRTITSHYNQCIFWQ